MTDAETAADAETEAEAEAEAEEDAGHTCDPSSPVPCRHQ